MHAILLDTHALYWVVSGEVALSEQALVATAESQDAGTLFVSPITAWELSIATRKANVATRPNLGDDPPDRWFRQAVRAIAARIAPIGTRISCEAAKVVEETGHKDPGDCFLIATARTRGIAIMTRDGPIQQIAAENADYLSVIAC